MNLKILKLLSVAATGFALLVNSALAMKVSDFDKLPADQGDNYLLGALSMMTFNYHVNNQPEKSKVINDYFFKANGAVDVMIEIAKAKKVNPNLQVEGIILGLSERELGKHNLTLEVIPPASTPQKKP